MLIRDKKQIVSIIVDIIKNYPIKRAAVFGSITCDNFTDDSDVDILIQPSEVLGLNFITLLLDLEDKLNRPVDLLTYSQVFSEADKDIHWDFKNTVLEQERVIYEVN